MTDQTVTFKTIIPFHGMLLTVVTHENKDYIPLKPIVEMLGTRWDSARKKVFSGDNNEIYSTRELILPEFNVLEALKGSKKMVHILLESAETYLMKTDTNRIRANGNHSAADYLLNLQKEWRKALHDYETKGYAIKSRNVEKINAIAKLDKIKDPNLRSILAQALNADFDLDIPIGKQMGLDV